MGGLLQILDSICDLGGEKKKFKREEISSTTICKQ
jgi:hypothetical protein